jgi:hypothetical protein
MFLTPSTETHRTHRIDGQATGDAFIAGDAKEWEDEERAAPERVGRRREEVREQQPLNAFCIREPNKS